MTRTKDTTVVTVLHPICCGLDIHKQFVTACLMTMDSMGKERSVLESFGTFTDDLVRLREWLLEHECPVVALESTGVYWRPVHNILEGYLTVVLVNARHIKNLPGRKTDMSDCQWIATLLRVGFVKASFIPPKTVRHWRELTRYRRSLVEALGDVKRQVHKLLESSNIKIDSVVSVLFGKTGRNLMDLLAKDQAELTLQAVHTCLKGRLKTKATELFRAVQGFFEDHHRWMLREMLERIDQQEANLARVESRLRDLLQPHDELIERITQIPGIGATSAYAILSETGTTLESFPNAASLMFLGRRVPRKQRERRKKTQHEESGPPKPSEDSSGGVGLGRSQNEGLLLAEQIFQSQIPLGSKESDHGHCSPDPQSAILHH